MNYRKIVEKNLKRKLKPSEIVHHIDGNQHNNSLLNLEVVQSQSEHTKKVDYKMYIIDYHYGVRNRPTSITGVDAGKPC